MVWLMKSIKQKLFTIGMEYLKGNALTVHNGYKYTIHNKF